MAPDLQHHWGKTMEHYVGIDVSLEQSSVCVVDGTGRILRETKVASEPEALIGWLHGLGLELTRVGLQAGPLSQWLYAAMRDAGLAVELLETRHVRNAFKAMPVKTDRKDARGIAQLLRLGEAGPRFRRRSRWNGQMRVVPAGAWQVSAGTGNAGSADRTQAVADEISRRDDEPARLRAEGRVDHAAALCSAHPRTGGRRCDPDGDRRGAAGRARDAWGATAGSGPASARPGARGQANPLLMTAPGVGAIVALTFVAAVDDPARFRSSKAVGAHFGLTPKKYPSGETDITGRISKIGDASVRTVLDEAANVILTRPVTGSALKSWAARLARRAGLPKAKVALARKLAVVMHRMLIDGTPFAAHRAAART